VNQYNKLREILNTGKQPVFSVSYLEKLKTLDTGCCLPGSVKIETLIVPVIAMHVHPKGFEYFGIDKKPWKNMNHRFRYLDNLDGDELVQLCLHFKQNRQLALNLDPCTEITRRFLSDIRVSGLYGFVFLCLAKTLFITSFTAPDDEEIGWFDRNVKRGNQLRRNDFERMLMDAMTNDSLSGQKEKKYYLPGKASVNDCFFNAKSTGVPLTRVNEYLC
jgi:hypothetical protein